MQRFFVQSHQIDKENKQILVSGSDVNHMKNVLRMRPGEEVCVSDGISMEYHCRIEDYEGEEARLEILWSEESAYELKNRLYLFQGLPKGDKMELIIQKAVELGAYAVIPVEMKRCVVKLDAKKAEKKRARWQQIAESAAKQSKRMVVPEVYPVMAFQEALRLAKTLDVQLLPYENARDMKETRERIDSIRSGQSVGIFIGPEGGFEEDEVASAMECGACTITLGKRILRTETAGMAVLSVLMFRLEEEE